MLMYQWVLIPLDSLQTLRLSQQWRKTILEPKRTWDWVFDMNERKWADFLKYNVLFRALVPEIRFGKGVPNQFQGFKLFRNVEPELVFCKGKKGNLGGEKEPWGVGWVFFHKGGGHSWSGPAGIKAYKENKYSVIHFSIKISHNTQFSKVPVWINHLRKSKNKSSI
jgi:hypothetical protein